MKRMILAGLSVVFSIGLFAQKALIVHKTDGTTEEFPMEALRGFYFAGKAIVNDGDYVSLSTSLRSDVSLAIDVAVEFHTNDPILAREYPQYGENWGILYSTSPDVTLENGTLVELDRQSIESIAEGSFSFCCTEIPKNNILPEQDSYSLMTLDFETTYYFRAYVRRSSNYGYEEAYFYSKEQAVYTDKPKMVYYGATIDPTPYAQTGYVMPSDSSWISLAERCPYIAVNGTCSDAIKGHWNTFLTVERIDSLKPLCTMVYECSDGMLYVLDSIGDDFAEYVTDSYDDEYVMSGYTELDDFMTVQSYVECSEEWGVPSNGYWKYAPASSRGNVGATYALSQPMLAGYLYTIEVTFAPDTEQVDTVPTRYDITYVYLNEKGKKNRVQFARQALASQNECTVVTFDSLVAGGFGEASIEIKSNVPSREYKYYSRTLRIAQIKVTPVGPYKQQEAVAVKEE